ncbi:Uncharacterized protein Adt_47622 [Abeliophyllum distichum]|uniref:Uncharacterized protein n=1 Tax=Abeliophyllum distichum TaxID=126358 RepID=A0ABD1NTD3_9LAMI
MRRARGLHDCIITVSSKMRFSPIQIQRDREKINFYMVSGENFWRLLFRSCLRATGGDALGRVGGEASPSVSPSMEGVLPIRGVDGSTGEAIHIDATPSLREADDPFRVDVVRWAALDVPSIMVEEDLTKLREAYRIPVVIKLIILGPNERACFPRKGCTALHLNAFVSGMRLPLHPMLRRILRAYDLAPTQVALNGWSQMVEGHVFVVSALVRHGNAFACVPNYLSAKEVAEEEGQGGGSMVVLLMSLGVS